MRKIDIRPEKLVYRPRDTIEGIVVIESDEEFSYNEIYLTFTGKEHTKIVRSTGQTTIVYNDDYIHFMARKDFEKKGIMTPGEKRLPFSFKLPGNSPSSYSGTSGWIEYTLDVIIEILKDQDVKESIQIQVKNPLTERTQSSVQDFAERDGQPVLEVELDSDGFCLGDDIIVKYRVSPNEKIRKVRFELLAKENATAEGINSKLTKTFMKVEIGEKEIIRDSWMETKLSTSDKMPLTIAQKLLQVDISLKVTLDKPWATDKIVIIPIIIGHCNIHDSSG